MTAITSSFARNRIESPSSSVEDGGLHGRLPATAAKTVAVVFIALLLGAVLDARGLRKTAAIQPPGLRRDVAMAVTRPLVSFSSATRLDSLRSGVKDALGRGDDDRITTTIVLPEPKVGPGRSSRSATGTGAPQKPARSRTTPRRPAPATSFTAKHPLRVWPAGDSLVIEPAYAIERLVARLPVRVLPVEGRVATGLERPDVYDWFARIRQVAPSLRGGTAVLAFGGNDDNAYMTALPETVRITAFWSPEWRREYGRRAGGVMDMLANRHAHVVWIGLPMTRDRRQTDRYAQLNAVVRREATRRPAWVTYVDTFWLLSDHGRYAEYFRTAGGKLVQLRQPDGVHFRPAAADMVARAVLKAIRKHVRLEEE